MMGLSSPSIYVLPYLLVSVALSLTYSLSTQHATHSQHVATQITGTQHAATLTQHSTKQRIQTQHATTQPQRYTRAYTRTGATVLSEFDKAFEIYKQCMKQVESLHDCVDVNLIPALIYMASFALLIFEPHQGAKLALNYIMVGEATCLALNATNTEVRSI